MARPFQDPPRDMIPAPKSIREVPGYLAKLIGSFFMRFGYIVKLVWDTGHWILFLLSFVALFKGVIPVVTALISKTILNNLQLSLQAGPQPAAAFWSSPIFMLLIFLFVHRVLLQTVNHVSRALNRIASEKVTVQVKLKIMRKSKELDLASFDNTAFYERMENASREAGMRPLSIITETFNTVSTIIEFVSYLVLLLTAPGLAWATLVIIAVCIPSAVINFVYRRKNFQYMRFRSKDRREMDYFSGLLVNKDMIKEVRMFDLADTFIGRFLGVFDNYFKGLRQLILAENIWHIVISVVSGITNLVFYILIALQVFTGDIMIGDYTLYTGAIAAVATCITALINSSGAIYEGTLFIDNLILFMKEQQTVIPSKTPGAKLTQKTGHTIEFQDVSFRYPGMDKDVLQQNLDAALSAMSLSFQRQIKIAKTKLATLAESAVLQEPTQYILQRRNGLEHINARMQAIQSQTISLKKQSYISLTAKLDAMSPLKVLTRGYAMVENKGAKDIIKSVKQINSGAPITITVSDGYIDAEVTGCKEYE